MDDPSGLATPSTAATVPAAAADGSVQATTGPVSISTHETATGSPAGKFLIHTNKAR